MSVTYTTDHTEPEKRPLGPAMWRGARGRCPNCGSGKLFRAYLKVVDSCPACGEELHHHRADDAPPYLTIVIVGHVLIGAMLHMEMVLRVNPVIYLWTLLPLAVVLPLIMLPWMKGAIVGLQWANYMHGFHPRFDPETDM